MAGIATAMAVGGALKGLGGIASGIIGSGARKKEQREAQLEYDRNKARLEGLDTSNIYTNMQNTMEDLTVNQGAAQFASEQANQGMANAMNTMGAAAGGSGIAAMAQALAGQQANQTRQASLDIGRQEQQNQQAERAQAAKLQLYEKKGEAMSRRAEQDKTETLFGMSQQRLGAATQARADATASIVGGVGDIAGGFLGGTKTGSELLGEIGKM